MRTEISADFLTLLNQGPKTALYYYDEIVEGLAKRLQLSEGSVVARHPDLVRTLVEVASQDYNNAIRVKSFQEEMGGLHDGLEFLGGCVRELRGRGE
jgi:hypothetical protein